MSVLSAGAQQAVSRFRFSLSVRGKFVLFAAAIACSTALIVGAVNYGRVVELTREEASHLLEEHARLIAPQIQGHYAAIRSDAFTIAYTPPFLGLARTLTHGGIDPKDGSTTAHWRDRLETIFVSLMAHRPAYVQMRYIGLADNGREIVRVNRAGERLERVPVAALQQKGGEPYFKASLRLKEGQFYVSPITPNVERGKPDPDLAVFRVVVPVNGTDNALFGFMVINVDAEAFFRSVLQSIDVDDETTLITDTDDYITRPEVGAISDFHLRGLNGPQAPAHLRDLHRTARSNQTIYTERLGEEVVLLTHRYYLDDVSGERRLTIVLTEPLAQFLSEAHKTRDQALLVGAAMVVVLSLIAVVAARILTQPLEDMVSAARAYTTGSADLKLPTERPDEIGEVSRAFTTLIRSMELARGAEAAALARARSLRDNAADAMISIKGDGTITSFNKAARVLFGYKEAEALGCNVSMLMPEPERSAHDFYLSRYLKTRQSSALRRVRTVEAQRKNGTRFPAELRVSEVDAYGERMFDGIIRDISARVAMEDKMAGYLADLERSNCDLDDFAQIASRDLKEPLRAIANHVRFLQEDYAGLLGEDGKHRIELLESLVGRIDRLISDLLMWSRLGRQELNPVPTDLNSLVGELVVSLAETLEARSATVTLVDSLPSLRCDRALVGNVFRNLIVNGITFNDSEERRIEIGIHTRHQAKAGEMVPVFFVRDNGIGIGSAYYDTIFAMFKRLNPDNDYSTGSGAGLCFVKKIVERHGGRIWLESQEGKGTTFYFTLKKTSRDQD